MGSDRGITKCQKISYFNDTEADEWIRIAAAIEAYCIQDEHPRLVRTPWQCDDMIAIPFVVFPKNR